MPLHVAYGGVGRAHHEQPTTLDDDDVDEFGPSYDAKYIYNMQQTEAAGSEFGNVIPSPPTVLQPNRKATIGGDSTEEVSSGQPTPLTPAWPLATTAADLFGGVAGALDLRDEAAVRTMEIGLTQRLKAAVEEKPKAEIDDGEMSEKENLLATCIAAGTFDLRTTVGGWWTKAVKHNAALAAEYKALGRNYAQQREFRLRWAEHEMASVKHERISTSQNFDSTGMDGSYKPIRVLIRDEGDDSSAIEAAFSIVAKCLDMYNKGITFKGRPVLHWNSWASRFEFMHLRYTFSSHFQQTWQERVVMGDSSGQTAVTAAATAVTAAASAAAIPETPMKIAASKTSGSTGGAPKAKAKAAASAGKRKTGGEAGGEMSPEEEKKKKARHDLDSKWRDISVLKVAFGKSISNYMSLAEQVRTHPKFMWADGEMKNEVQPLKNALDLEISSCEFFRAFAVQEMQVLKKRFDPSSANFVILSGKIEGLQAAIDCVIRMTNAR